MTKTVFSTAIYFVLFSIILKIAVWIGAKQYTLWDLYLGLGYIFFLMVAIFIRIRKHKLNVGSNSTFLGDFKAGMRVTGLYALLMAVFLFIYYRFIDPDYFTIMLQMKVADATAAGNTNIEQIKQSGEVILSPFFQSTISLIIFLVIGAFYSFLIAFFMRKMKGYGH